MSQLPSDDNRPTALEQRLVELLLSGDPEPMPALREQWTRAWVTGRVFHEFGTDTTFALPPGETPVWPWTQEYGDLQFRLGASDAWRSMHLEIEAGLIAVLRYEAYELEVVANATMTEWSYTDYIEPPGYEDGEVEAELIHVPERRWESHHWWMNMMREKRERGEDGPRERPQGLRLV